MDISMRADIKRSSKITYSSAVSKYLDFCQGLGVQHERRNLTEKQLCKLCWLYCHDCKETGLASWVSAISDYHMRQGWAPLPRGLRYARTRKAIKNIFGQVDLRAPAVPISKAQLLLIRDRLDLSNLKHAMFWLGCLLGFQALLRASEFCGGSLRWKHVKQITGGVRLCVPYSKTKLTPHLVSVVTDGGDFCVLQAIMLVLRLQGKVQQTGAVVRLSYDQFNAMLKRFYAEAVGDPLGISSHSLRRGGASSLVFSGVSEPAIMALGRWTSQAWREYIDLSAVQQLAASHALLHA